MNSKRILIAFSIAVLSAAACRKAGTATIVATSDETATTTTVAATVTNTGTYTYTLPSASYAITTQATHAASSSIAALNTTAATFTYAPAANFTGVDTVIVSPTDTMNMPGGCMHHDSTAASRPIAFHITVTASK